MNTKSLLFAAVVAAVGAVSGSAQVVSQNIVGYIRLNLNSGFNLISNQLNNGNNQIGTVLTGVPEGTDAYKFNGTSYVANSFSEGAWDNAAMTLAPGEGFFLRVGAATQVTLIGEVSLQNSVPLRSGFNLLGVPVPIPGGLTTATAGNFNVSEGDDFYSFNGTSFVANSFSEGAWDGGEPQIAIGQGFFIRTSTARSYVRNFSTN
jgi:hypothetical protein